LIVKSNLLFLLLMFAISVAGCSRHWIRDSYRMNEIFSYDKAFTSTSGSNASIIYKKGKNGKPDVDSTAFQALYSKATGTGTDGEAKGARNEIIAQMINMSDKMYQTNEAIIVGRSVLFNSATGITGVILTSLGTVLGGEGVKSALHAAATITQGVNTTINKEVLLKQMAVVVVKAMDNRREEIKNVIRANMKKHISEYSIQDGIMDVTEYHHAGSFVNGIKIVSETIDVKGPTKAEVRLKIVELEEQIKKADEDLKKDLPFGAKDYKSKIDKLAKSIDEYEADITKKEEEMKKEDSIVKLLETARDEMKDIEDLAGNKIPNLSDNEKEKREESARKALAKAKEDIKKLHGITFNDSDIGTIGTRKTTISELGKAIEVLVSDIKNLQKEELKKAKLYNDALGEDGKKLNDSVNEMKLKLLDLRKQLVDAW